MPTNAQRLISDRILAIEWARRGGPPAAGGWVAELADLPPLSILADRAFPSWVLERRLRFWAALGYWPGPGRLDGGLDDIRLPCARAEDYAAWVYGSPAVATADAFLASLARSLGRDCDGPPNGPDPQGRLERFFLRWGGAPQPDPWPPAVPPAYARLEAATITGDRWFGRRGPSPGWDRLSTAVGWAGRTKRRLRP